MKLLLKKSFLFDRVSKMSNIALNNKEYKHMMQSIRHPNRILLAALALGVCADRLFYGRWLGVSAPLFVGLCLLVLGACTKAEDRLPTRANLWLGAGALVFALALALRDAPLLIALNTLAVLGLLTLLVACYQGEALARLPAARMLMQVVLAVVELLLRPMPLIAQFGSGVHVERQQVRRVIPFVRGLLLAAPVLACFTGLLVAADSVFASYVTQIVRFQLPFDGASLISHSIFALVFAWICAGGLVVALLVERRPNSVDPSSAALPAEGETRRLEPLQGASGVRLGSVEALIVLCSVDLLFGGFMLIQAAYFFGGMDTLNRTGMTYASYARRGFFEMLAVACLSLGLLWMLATVTRRELIWQRRSFNIANGAMIVLVLGLLGSAFERMLLYEQAYGYTRLRVYTHSFMLWLALVLLLFLVALLRNRPRVFTFGGFVSALIYLALLNLLNPDALIVHENMARYGETGKLDTDYLTSLSADATPALVTVLPTLDNASRDAITQALSWQLTTLKHDDEQDGWPSWHLARAQARTALEDHGIVAARDDAQTGER